MPPDSCGCNQFAACAPACSRALAPGSSVRHSVLLLHLQWRFYEFLGLRIEDLPKASAVVSDIRKILRQVGGCGVCCPHELGAAPAHVAGHDQRSAWHGHVTCLHLKPLWFLHWLHRPSFLHRGRPASFGPLF